MVKIYMAMKEGETLLSNSTTSLLDSQLLLSHVLDVERTYLILNREKELSDAQYFKFKEYVEKRKNGEPLQYIIGSQEFMGLPFNVEKGVLIPRCDTETLVEEAINILRNMESPVVADVGCGSGAISVSLASFVKDSIVYALDIMDTPLKVTKENSILNNVENRVNVKRSNMLEVLSDMNRQLNMIISNPPYIREDVIPTLMTEVKDFEPIEALVGGDDGLKFYRDITKQSRPLLKKGGYLLYEIGHDQGEDVKSIMESEGFENIKIIKDLAGHNRVVLGNI